MYRKPGAVEESENGNLLVDHYIQTFKKKFHIAPHLEFEDRDTLQQLSTKLGLAQAKDVVEVYFTVEDREFVENGYTPFWLKKKLNRVLTQVGKRSSLLEASRGLRIRCNYFCCLPDGCNKDMEVIVSDTKLFDAPLYCRACAEKLGKESYEYVEVASTTG